MTQNTNYRRFETGNGNPAAMALEDYQDKIDRLHERSERRRLDGAKPTKAQIDMPKKTDTTKTIKQ